MGRIVFLLLFSLLSYVFASDTILGKRGSRQAPMDDQLLYSIIYNLYGPDHIDTIMDAPPSVAIPHLASITEHADPITIDLIDKIIHEPSFQELMQSVDAPPWVGDIASYQSIPLPATLQYPGHEAHAAFLKLIIILDMLIAHKEKGAPLPHWHTPSAIQPSVRYMVAFKIMSESTNLTPALVRQDSARPSIKNWWDCAAHNQIPFALPKNFMVAPLKIDNILNLFNRKRGRPDKIGLLNLERNIGEQMTLVLSLIGAEIFGSAHLRNRQLNRMGSVRELCLHIISNNTPLAHENPRIIQKIQQTAETIHPPYLQLAMLCFRVAYVSALPWPILHPNSILEDNFSIEYLLLGKPKKGRGLVALHKLFLEQYFMPAAKSTAQQEALTYSESAQMVLQEWLNPEDIAELQGDLHSGILSVPLLWRILDRIAEYARDVCNINIDSDIPTMKERLQILGPMRVAISDRSTFVSLQGEVDDLGYGGEMLFTLILPRKASLHRSSKNLLAHSFHAFSSIRPEWGGHIQRLTDILSQNIICEMSGDPIIDFSRAEVKSPDWEK